MKFTLSWLKRFLDTDLGLDAITDALTSLGIEVESVLDRSKDLEPFIIAEILEANQHPNADRLRVCKVHDGRETRTIVCGAPNARAGIKVVLAREGVKIPANGLIIKLTKIRDVESCGMMCSSTELGIGNDSDGIIEIDANAAVGSRFIDLSPELVDPVVEVSITPNRGDCLGIYGIARELAAAGIGTLKSLKTPELKPTIHNPVVIKVQNEEDCPLFAARYFSNVKNCESPKWLQSLLRAIGEEPISALVDITNYMCYSFARPLHVFNAESFAGDFIVRRAEPKERLLALDDKEYTMLGGEIVLADQKGILGLAGIMGGKNSGSYMDTRKVLLESAIFNKRAIARTGRIHQIDSDARARFERGLDLEFVILGADIATQMILEICGGEVSEVSVIGNVDIQPTEVELRVEAVKSLSGIDVAESTIISILNNLGFICEFVNVGVYKVKAPSWRHDISIEQDLVEEILRVNNYDKIVAIPLPAFGDLVPIFDKKQLRISQLKRALVAHGLDEMVTWSFMSDKNSKLFDVYDNNMEIANPISSELNCMRSSIIPNLINALVHNQNRSVNNPALFEMGPVFSYEQAFVQKTTLTAVRSGINKEKNIYKDSREYDVFDIKADMYHAFKALDIDLQSICFISEGLPKFMHPGRSALVKYRNKVIGVFGELHPELVRKFDLNSAVNLLELNLDELAIGSKSKSTYVYSNFQMVERDFAFVLDRSMPVEDLLRLVRNVDKKLVCSVHLFDVYEGKNIEENKKSVAISVKLQSLEKTLTNEEIEQISATIVKQVEQKLGGVLRA